MARRKQVALDVPATVVEATELLGEYVALERAMLQERLATAIVVERFEAESAARLAEMAGPQEERFRALKAWWEAGAAGGSKTRSTEIAGARIGIRLTPPKVKFARGIKADAVVAWLGKLRWPRKKDFLRTKVELDKQAVIKAVQAEPAVKAKFADRLSVVQTDEFFIDAGLDEDAMRKALVEGGAEGGAQ